MNNMLNPFTEPPLQSLEAEQAVLGSILLDPDVLLQVIELIKPKDFYCNTHKLIFEAILELFDKGEPVDIVTVSEFLKDKGLLDDVGGRSYINDLSLAIALSRNAYYYAGIVYSEAVKRRLLDFAYQAACLAHSEDSGQDALLKADKLLRSISEGCQQGDSAKLIGELLPEGFERVEARYNNKGRLMGIPTGFKGLDNVLGGLHAGNFVCIGARPSMGKTAFALQLARNVALNDIPVLIQSLEMSSEELVDRIITSESEVDSKLVRSGKLEHAHFVKISHTLGVLGDVPLIIDDTSTLSMTALRAKAHIFKKRFPEAKLIIVDYLQLMDGESRDRRELNRVQEVSAISRGLKLLAKELKVTVVALSQLSRNVESRADKRPVLSDLRESGSIEQDSDVVMFLYRDDYYFPDTNKPGNTEVIITKQRNGPIGQVELLFNKSITKFYDVVRF